MAGVFDYNTDPALNTTVGGVFIGEMCPAANLNDGERAMMADIASYRAAANGPLEKTAGGAMVGGAITDMGATSSVRDGGGTARPIGFLDLPLTAGTSGRVIALTDRGLAIPATGNMTIPTNATTAFPVGSLVGIYNNSGSSITIAAVTPGTTTLRLGGSATTGTRTLAQRGYVLLWKVATDEWVALNGGIS